jgi:SprT protein
MFRVRGKECEIRYNPWIFARYYEESLGSTVPHEVAHYIVHRLYGLHRVQAHGEEWQAIMAAFGADARVTSNHDLTGIPHRRQRRWLYLCPCQEHHISTRRHNRIIGGKDSYLCRSCGGELLQALKDQPG